ncbi:hypothetical protein KKG90_00655 [Candidatus Bipolaricaulota bacterium]|nr:hypothetical protein [Candidatus Bipolaricaulota bacterium]
MKGKSLVVGVLCIAVLSVSGSAFAPYWHLTMNLGALEGAGFSEGQAWMLAYFDVEVDIATEIPMVLCQFPVRWPTSNYVCPNVGRIYGEGYDPCAPGGWFDDWCEYCLPFHCPGVRPAHGLAEVIQEWRLESMQGAMHYMAGERSYDWLQRVGHMLHAMQDFYAHSNWIEVFHWNLGFPFGSIPSYTSFMRSQRGERLNLILLDHANGNESEAMRLYDILNETLVVENHDLWNKDSNDWNDNCYGEGSGEHHRDDDGHTVVDFHAEAVRVASADTYQLGVRIRNNIVNHPEFGQAVWAMLFGCVEEMAAYDRVSYEDFLDTYQDAIGRVETYAGIIGIWE